MGDLFEFAVDVTRRHAARLMKVAVRRDPAVPVGQPAPLHLICAVCQQRVDLVGDQDTTTCGTCGEAYTSTGWRLAPASEKGALR